MRERPEWVWFLVSNESEAEIVCAKECPKMSHSGGKWTSSSGWHATREELVAEKGIPESPCVDCGNVFHTNYIPEVKDRLLSANRCHTCDFWTQLIGNPNAIVVGGCHYMDSGTDNTNTRWNGFGGRKWKYSKNGGEPKETNNMWFQGEIPERFRDRIPDNSVFL